MSNNHVKYLFDRRTLITMIDSLVFSTLLYCSSVWANTTNKNIELLPTVQNFAAWIISGTRKFDHVTPILKQLQWLPIIKHLAVIWKLLELHVRHVLDYSPL